LDAAGTIFMGGAGPNTATTESVGTGLGYAALAAHTAGNGCTAFGYRALGADVNGVDHTAVGDRAMSSNSGGVGCCAFGKFSLQNNVSGGGNSGFGDSTLRYNTTGTWNTAVGYIALENVTTGTGNTAIGFNAGHSISGAASNNIFIGYASGLNVSQKTDVTNSIAIGANTYTNTNNQVVLGNTNITHTYLYGDVSWTTTWNDAGTTFQAFTVDVTDTSSASGSLLAAFRNNGITYASIRKDGRITGANFVGTATSSYLVLNDASITRVGAATLLCNGGYGGTERSANPADPSEGCHVIWQSDGTGAGDDGDIMIKITAGGVTKIATLIDFSAI
jgi:hypothetical protein